MEIAASHLIDSFLEDSTLPQSPPVSPLFEERRPYFPVPHDVQPIDPSIFFTADTFDKYTASVSFGSLWNKNRNRSLDSKEESQTEEKEVEVTFSWLSQQEHILYLDLERKYVHDQQRMAHLASHPPNRPPPAVAPPQLTPELVSLYQKLRSIVLKEQENYRKKLYNDALAQKEIYFHLHPKVEETFQKVNQRKKGIIEKWPPFFEVHTAFDLRTIQVQSNDPVLQHKETLHQEGKCLLFLKSPTEIPLDIEYVTQGRRSEGDRWQKKSMPALSEDLNVKRILSQHHVDIVIGSSALVTIIDNHEPTFWESWEIPVLSEMVQGPQGSHRVIYLEKRLPRKKVTPRAKNEFFYSVAFKSLGVALPKIAKGINFDPPVQQTNATADQNGNENLGTSPEEENLTYNLWQFGDLTVLIRCQIHGMIEQPQTPQGFRYVGFKAKIEFQPSRGKEEVTMSETARWWIYTFIRPDADLLLGNTFLCLTSARVNPFTSTIIEVEHKNMRNILPPGCLFRPERSSKILHVTLKHLSGLEPGKYLLSHKSGDYNVVTYRGIETVGMTSAAFYDLRKAHRDSPLSDTDTIPYIPTRWIPRPNQIPDTFPIDPSKESVIVLPSPVPAGSPPKKQKRDEKEKAKIVKGVRYCHGFAQHGHCRLSSECPFPHLTLEQVQQEKDKKKTKGKKKGRERNPQSGSDLSVAMMNALQ